MVHLFRAARSVLLPVVLSAMPALALSGTWSANIQASDWDTTLDHRPNGSGLGFDLYSLDPSEIGFTAMERLVYNAELDRFQLKAMAALDLRLTSWNQAHAMVNASAYYRDGVTVLRDPMGEQGGTIEFTWQIDGTASTHVRSPGHGPFNYYLDRYTELYAIAPGPDGIGVRTTLFEHCPDLCDPLIYSAPEPFPAHDRGAEYTTEETNEMSFGPQTVTLSVPFASGVLLSIDFGLFTGLTTSFYNIDYTGTLYADLENDFSNTATLQSVRVLDGLGNPLAADAFSLSSANGYSYPLFTTAVPEPPVWALSLAALLLMGRRQPPARQSAVSPAKPKV